MSLSVANFDWFLGTDMAKKGDFLTREEFIIVFIVLLQTRSSYESGHRYWKCG